MSLVNDVEEMAHGKSASIALTVSVFISGAPGGATRTLRPYFSTSLARQVSSRCKTSLWPSRAMETRSPGWSCRALRNRLGMTTWPLVESVAVLLREILPVLH